VFGSVGVLVALRTFGSARGFDRDRLNLGCVMLLSLIV
jgi:hypothetical protein